MDNLNDDYLYDDFGIRTITPDNNSEDGEQQGAPTDTQIQLALLNQMARQDEEAFELAVAVGRECSKFCQDYSHYQGLKLRYSEHAKDKAFAPEVEPTPIDEEEDDESMVFGSPLSFYDLRVTVRDARAIGKAWERSGHANPGLEASLATYLNLCSRKIKIATLQFAQYYDERSAREKSLITLYSEMQVKLMLRLAGVVLAEDKAPAPPTAGRLPHINIHESRLTEAGVDFSDVPEEFLCPVLGEIMDEPIRIGKDNRWFTYNAPALDQLWQEENVSARCPQSRFLLSELTFEVDKDLDKRIKTWVEAKLESARPSSKPDLK